MIDENIPAGDGIYGQMQNTEKPTETTNQMPSLEDFREMMVSMARCYDKEPLTPIDDDPIPVSPMIGIKLKIKEGYLYQLGSGKWQAVTGYGGALNYVDVCRHKGIPDVLIGEDIFITETEGIVSGQVWTCLNKIEWHKKETDDNKG